MPIDPCAVSRTRQGLLVDRDGRWGDWETGRLGDGVYTSLERSENPRNPPAWCANPLGNPTSAHPLNPPFQGGL